MDAGPRLRWRGPLPATWALLALLVGAHLATAWWLVRHGEADAWTGLWGPRPPRARILVGGQYRPLVASGEVWRLGSSVLLHAGAVHLAMNAVALAALGRLLEPLLGAVRWLGIAVAGGLAGSLAAQLSGIAQSDGASGAAFALLGAGVVLGARWPLPAEDGRLLVRGLGAFAGLNIVLSLVVPALDASAHLVGMAVGAALGAVVRPRR